MARRFRFSLEPLLDQRRRVEEAQQRDFAARRCVLKDCEAELKRLAQAYCRCATELADFAGNSRTMDLIIRDGFLRFIEATMARERSHRAQLQAACDRSQEQLVAASRERRVIEKFKGRRRREFDAEEARREEFEIDESNVRRYERNLRERRVECQPERAAP